MNWSKARKILLISLAIANAILFFFNFRDYLNLRDETTSKSFVRKVEQMLNDDGILLDCDIPRNRGKLSSLSVEFETYLPEKLNETFFKNEAKITHPSGDRVELERNGEYLNIVNSRRIFYENTNSENIIDDLDEDKAIEIANEFLIDHKFDPNDLELSEIRKEEDRYFLNFDKIYESIVLQSSYTTFVIDKRGVVSMDRLWLDVISKSQKNIWISSAPRALLTLLEKDYSQKEITKIEQCYYFNPEDQGYVDDITKALQGRAIPAWRVQFSDGDSTVIDNY